MNALLLRFVIAGALGLGTSLSSKGYFNEFAEGKTMSYIESEQGIVSGESVSLPDQADSNGNSTAHSSAGPLGGYSTSGTLNAELAYGRIGLAATSRSTKTGAADHYAGTSIHGLADYLDYVSFYSRSIPYASILELHLQAKVTGSANAMTLAAPGSQAYEQTYAAFNFWVANDETLDQDSYITRSETFDGYPVQWDTTGDRTLDINIEVVNSPNFKYFLRMSAEVYGATSVTVHQDASSDYATAGFDLLFNHSIAWNGMISATLLDGTPVKNLSIISDVGIDYTHSYVLPEVPPTPVPEPSTYGLGATLLFGAVVYIKRRKSSRITV